MTIRELFAAVATRRPARPGRAPGGSAPSASRGGDVAVTREPAAVGDLAEPDGTDDMLPLVVPAAGTADDPPVGLDLAPATDSREARSSFTDAPQAVPGEEPAAPGDVTASPAPASLDTLFGRRTAPADEAAATTLANAYGEPAHPPVSDPASPTLDQFFDAQAQRPRETPRTAEAARRASAFSFDEFFAARPPAAPTEAQSSPTAESERETDETAARDIEQFNAWLEGLKQK